MSTITTLILIQQYMTRYLLSTILAIGTLGNLLAIGNFFKTNSRKSSCSIYLVAISSFGLVASWWAIVPLINALDHFDMVNSSLILCRTRGYIIHVTSMCFRYTIVLLCIDRYASCHPRASIRALCRPQIAYRSIFILTIFWSIATFHLLVWERIENNRCAIYGVYGQVFSFYSLVFTGILPILCMTLISIPLMKNLHNLRSRIQPQYNNGQIVKRDGKLMRIVLAEALVYVFCTITYPIMLIYCTVTDNMGLQKSADRKQKESFVNFIAMSLLLYLNYSTPFYVHLFGSNTYRKEIKQFLIKLVPKSIFKQSNEGGTQKTANVTKAKQQKQITSTL